MNGLGNQAGQMMRAGMQNEKAEQRWINDHKGYNHGTGSEGCFTIYKNDNNKFIDDMDYNQLGKYYLIR